MHHWFKQHPVPDTVHKTSGIHQDLGPPVSHVKGNLVSSSLTIEEGARFDGECNMQDKNSSSSVNKQKINA